MECRTANVESFEAQDKRRMTCHPGSATADEGSRRGTEMLRCAQHDTSRFRYPFSIRHSPFAIRQSTFSVVLTLLMFQVNCIAPRRVITPRVDPSTLDDTAFLHYLATVPTVSVAEGVRAVGLLARPTQRFATFEDQRKHLESLGAVKSSWRLRPHDTLDKGTLAYMLTAICNTPRSIGETTSAVIGFGDRRYALKTCIDEGLLPYGVAHDAVTGGELLSAVIKAERYPVSTGN